MVMDPADTTEYLRRIGVQQVADARSPGLDAVALRELHLAHQRSVPFENLSIHLAEPISLQPEDLLAKVIKRRRGGFCHELNGAFAMLLEALGAQVSRVSARVSGEKGLGPPFDHLALIVRPADGSGPWLADVGFGAHSAYPLLADSREVQHDPAGEFAVAETEEGDLDVYRDGSLQYRIELRPRDLADFIPTCWYQQTSPLSHFRHSVICSLVTADGRVSLSGRTLIRTAAGTRTEQDLTDDAAVLAAYRDIFGIELDRVPVAVAPDAA
jgi:N-hydroxyarylamine O-acetyltransferase